MIRSSEAFVLPVSLQEPPATRDMDYHQRVKYALWSTQVLVLVYLASEAKLLTDGAAARSFVRYRQSGSNQVQSFTIPICSWRNLSKVAEAVCQESSKNAHKLKKQTMAKAVRGAYSKWNQNTNKELTEQPWKIEWNQNFRCQSPSICIHRHRSRWRLLSETPLSLADLPFWVVVGIFSLSVKNFSEFLPGWGLDLCPTKTSLDLPC